MNICVAQLSVLNGNIESNIAKHINLINTAIEHSASAIFFPELSITGYEPELAQDLAFEKDYISLDVFQELSDTNNIVIGVGLPTKGAVKPNISMLIFQPQRSRVIYSKQYLHPGEEEFFMPGEGQVFIEIEDYKIAPAICYESSVEQHQKYAMSHGANIYIASVLNSKAGIDKEMKSLSEVASEYNVTVMMSNYIGESGGYESAGSSSVWNDCGSSVGQLNEMEEGLLIFDTDTKLCQKVLV